MNDSKVFDSQIDIHRIKHFCKDILAVLGEKSTHLPSQHEAVDS
jgi:hypothetical protein